MVQEKQTEGVRNKHSSSTVSKEQVLLLFSIMQRLRKKALTNAKGCKAGLRALLGIMFMFVWHLVAPLNHLSIVYSVPQATIGGLSRWPMPSSKLTAQAGILHVYTFQALVVFKMPFLQQPVCFLLPPSLSHGPLVLKS